MILFIFFLMLIVNTINGFKNNRPLNPQPRWGLVNKPDKKVTVEEVIAILGRFKQRTDFYIGEGYSRKSCKNGLLTSELFYESINKLKFNTKNWPRNKNNELFGTEGLNKKEIKEMENRLKNIGTISSEATDAIFTTLAKGATNGLSYPQQVDEEMQKWLYNNDDGSRIFDLNAFERSLLNGRFQVFLGWFLYIGLQFGGVYVVFFVPIMQNILGYTDIDFYPIQTLLHTETWGK